MRGKIGNWRFIVCGAGALAMLGVSSAKAQNVLADPGFEVSQGNVDASAGDQFGANGWVVFGGGTYTTSALAHGGTQSFKSFGQYNGAYQQFAVTPGEVLTGSVYSATTAGDTFNGTAAMEMDLFTDANGDGPTYNSFPLSTPVTSGDGGTWGFLQQTVTVPAGDAFVRYQLIQTAYSGGSVDYDDASLTITPVPEPASLGLLSLTLIPLLRRRRA